MANSSATNPFAQHYLEISALEPTTNQEIPPFINPQQVVTWPIMLCLLVFIGFFSVLFFKRMHDLRSVFMVFLFALIIGAMPLALQSIGTTTQLSTKANPDLTPRNLIVTSVTPTGFVISWDTNRSTTGALKISQNANLQNQPYIFPDPEVGSHHRLVVLNLHPGTTYYLQVLSDTLWFDHAGHPITITLPVE